MDSSPSPSPTNFSSSLTESGRPNNRKPEDRILLTIRPKRKAKFDRKAKNLSSLKSLRQEHPS